MEPRPIISLCHATARLPLGWKAAADAWLSNARRCSLADGSLEYVLCVDQADAQKLPMDQIPDGSKVAVNMGRSCSVDGWNVAASVATGDVLICIADDWFPSGENWDGLLLDLLNSRVPAGASADAVERFAYDGAELRDIQRVVWVGTGGNPGLMQFSILTRAYYERYGRVFHPEYTSMFSDNDFQEQAHADGVLLDARELLPKFPHLHPAFGTAEPDAIYARQNQPRAYELGSRIFAKRWPDAWRRLYPGRPLPVEGAPAEGPQRIIAVCLLGETFSSAYLCAWTELLPHIIGRGLGVAPVFGFTANPHVTRAGAWYDMRRSVVRPDLVLWIDHDNVVPRAVFDKLLETLDNKPDADVVAGWSWILHDASEIGVKVSCGRMLPDGSDVQTVPVDEMLVLQEQGGLLPVEWTGFPCVLMRFSALERAAAVAATRNGVANPFCPIISPNSLWGHSGEDIAFSVNLTDAGGSIYVDTGCFVQHLKLRAIGPRKKAAPAPAVETVAEVAKV